MNLTRTSQRSSNGCFRLPPSPYVEGHAREAIVPAERPTSDELTYHGLTGDNGNTMILIENARGDPIGTVQHLPKHSPTGMNWGFAGSGPADTARSLLVAALGPAAICPTCNGTNRVVYVSDDSEGTTVPEPFEPSRHRWTRKGWQCECDGGYICLPYPRFADQVVSHWGPEWTMTQASILNWLFTMQAD